MFILLTLEKIHLYVYFAKFKKIHFVNYFQIQIFK